MEPIGDYSNFDFISFFGVFLPFPGVSPEIKIEPLDFDASYINNRIFGTKIWCHSAILEVEVPQLDTGVRHSTILWFLLVALLDMCRTETLVR